MEIVNGKISVVNHPIIKGKDGRSPLSALNDWKYENGVMTSKWVLGGRKTINLALATKTVELAPEALALLAGLKKSNELTANYMMAGAAFLPLMDLFQDIKFKGIRNTQVLIDLEFRDDFEMPVKYRGCGETDGFMGFTTLEVFAHIHDLARDCK